MQTKSKQASSWISRDKLEQAITTSSILMQYPDAVEDLHEILNTIEVTDGEISFRGEWHKLSINDPDMDQTERTMFPDETYKCSHCGAHAYFGATCTRDAYCQKCGAKMLNAGRRK